MIRFNLLLSLFLCFFIKVSAQRQNTYFIKNNGQYVTQREAVRVMKRSPLWEPGLFRGKPARVAFNVPISFNISSH